MNTATINHEIAAIKAATFILVITKSAFVSGRTATNEGMDISPDHQSGFDSAFPTGNPRTSGTARVAASIRMVLTSSFLRSQERGPMTTINVAPTSNGRRKPEFLHSNQKCADAAEEKGAVRRGNTSEMRSTMDTVHRRLDPPPDLCRAT